jgi:hypothetical protein
MNRENEFTRFDAGVRQILSVSREELKRREEEWKQEQAEKKRAKSSSHAPAVPAKHS